MFFTSIKYHRATTIEKIHGFLQFCPYSIPQWAQHGQTPGFCFFCQYAYLPFDYPAFHNFWMVLPFLGYICHDSGWQRRFEQSHVGHPNLTQGFQTWLLGSPLPTPSSCLQVLLCWPAISLWLAEWWLLYGAEALHSPRAGIGAFSSAANELYGMFASLELAVTASGLGSQCLVKDKHCAIGGNACPRMFYVILKSPRFCNTVTWSRKPKVRLGIGLIVSGSGHMG